MLRVGVSEAVAYRAEMLVWVLATTMPLVMMALWTAVAREAPVGRYGQADFVAYFLATFIVRQMTGSWAAWEINYEVRTGRLAQRLLRPIHPLASYAAENLGAMPLRLVVAIPVAGLSLWTVGASRLPHDWRLWLIWCFAMLGSWLITLLANLAIGSLSLMMEQSLKVLDVWFTLFMALSGYIIPVELFPGWLRGVVEWLPFRYQIGYPVELMTSAHGLGDALWLLLRQWGWVAFGFAVTALIWKRGQRRFEAYGG
jgi:ABC-2 type transport system permease protein